MKIVFLVKNFPKISETFILNQITGLIDRGHQVSVLAVNYDYDRITHQVFDKYNLENITRRLVPKQKAVRYIKLLFIFLKNFRESNCLMTAYLKKKIFKWTELYSTTMYALDFLKDKDVDIIHCHFGSIGNIGAGLKIIGIKAKLVTTFHGCDIRQGMYNMDRLDRDIYQLLKEMGDCFISISGYNRRCLEHLNFSSNKIIDIPVGVDLNLYIPKKYNNFHRGKQSLIKIVTVARLVEEKGIKYALYAIRRLLDSQSHLNLQYTIIGDGYLMNELTSLTKKLKLDRVVIFLGFKKQNDAAEIIRKSDLFILPSIAEALPVSLMEAQAIGLPAIATNVGSVDEIIIDGKSGFIVPPQKIDPIFNRISYLLKCYHQWPMMGKVARENIERNFDIKKICLKLEDVYRQISN